MCRKYWKKHVKERLPKQAYKCIHAGFEITFSSVRWGMMLKRKEGKHSNQQTHGSQQSDQTQICNYSQMWYLEQLMRSPKHAWTQLYKYVQGFSSQPFVRRLCVYKSLRILNFRVIQIFFTCEIFSRSYVPLPLIPQVRTNFIILK